MLLTDEDVREFQELYLTEYDTELSFVDAQEQLSRLLNFFRTVYRPIPTNRPP